MKSFAEGLGAVLDVLQRLAVLALVVMVLFMPSWFPLLDRFVFETTKINILGTELKVVDTRGVQGLEVRDGKLFLGGEDIANLPDQRDRARSEAATLREDVARLTRELATAATALERAAQTPAGDDAAAAAAARLSQLAQQEAERPRPTPAPPPVPQQTAFGIVFGADRTRPSAMDEVARARAAGPATVSLWLRQGFWRGIAEFESRQAAQAALPAYARFRPDAYVVEFRSWCPNAVARPSEADAPGVRLLDCGF